MKAKKQIEDKKDNIINMGGHKMIPNGRILVDVGEERKRALRIEIGRRGLTLREFICEIIDKYFEESGEVQND